MFGYRFIKRTIWSVIILALLAAVLSGGYWWKKSQTEVTGEVFVVKNWSYTPPESILGFEVKAEAVISVPWGQKLVGTTLELSPDSGVLTRSEVKVSNEYLNWGRIEKRIKITLVPFNTGSLNVGSLKLEYERPKAKNELNSDALSLVFPTLEVAPLTSERSEQLPLAGVMELKQFSYGYLFLGGLLLLLLGLLAWGIYMFIKATKKAVQAPIASWAAALNQLRDLRENIGQFSAEESFVKTTDILRIYVEKRFELPVSSATTPEFLYSLKYKEVFLSSSQKGRLSEFMESADLIKFAKAKLEEKDLLEAIYKAEKFVEETIPAPETQEVKGV